MVHDYSIIDVGDWTVREDETLGTKEKFWLDSPLGERWLFKHPRPGSGEHWAEAVAARVASILRIPHAIVELAQHHGEIGSICRSILHGHGRPRALLLGNDLLHRTDSSYRRGDRRPREHSVESVLRHLSRIAPPPNTPRADGIRSAADVFVGYLMLDALIGNTDRHHENWAVITGVTDEHAAAMLAPTFDHASSLGRELTDRRRQTKLESGHGAHGVDAYCAKASSPLFDQTAAGPALTVRRAFGEARATRPRAAHVWLEILRETEPCSLESAVSDLPDEVATAATKRFAIAVLHSNRAHLLRETL